MQPQQPSQEIEQRANQEIEQRELDRLVDGELTGEEYRLLLERIEAADDGWRRCGLAFLEAQMLERELGALTRPATAPRLVSLPPQRLRGRAAELAGWSMALAASLALAFWLGGAFDPSPRETNQPAAPALARGSAAEATSPPAAEVPSDVTLLVGGEGSGDLSSVRVPLVQTAPEQADWLSGEVSGMPEEVRRYLESQGRRVHRTYRVMNVDLGGGCRALVPLEQFEVDSVRSEGYQ